MAQIEGAYLHEKYNGTTYDIALYDSVEDVGDCYYECAYWPNGYGNGESVMAYLAATEDNTSEAYAQYGTPQEFHRADGTTFWLLTEPYVNQIAGLADGVYVAASYGGRLYAFTSDEWGSGIDGYTPTGVLVVSGEHRIVVAMEEKNNIPWSTVASTLTGGTVTINETTALADYDGAGNTEKAAEQMGAVTDATAVGYCRLYSCGALGEGSWHLPSNGEFQIIADNTVAVNTLMKAIGGTRLQLGDEGSDLAGYWSSTQYSATQAWGFLVWPASGLVYWGSVGKSYTGEDCWARPVSAL